MRKIITNGRIEKNLAQHNKSECRSLFGFSYMKIFQIVSLIDSYLTIVNYTYWTRCSFATVTTEVSTYGVANTEKIYIISKQSEILRVLLLNEYLTTHLKINSTAIEI